MSTINNHEIVQTASRFFFYTGAALMLLLIAWMQATSSTTEPGMFRAAISGTLALLAGVGILSFYLLYIAIRTWKEDN